jgi:hypothetical protein
VGSVATSQAQSGDMAHERRRVAELVGDTVIASQAGAGMLPLARLALFHGGISVDGVLPRIRVAWNSELPYSFNDGPLWAGRGLNGSITTGAALEYRGAARVRAVIAPTLAYSQNLPFQIFPGPESGSAYANPFHSGPESFIDLPHRFGDRHLLTIDPGLSLVEVEARRWAVGATARSDWWGPGIRNALLVSSNAPGIPRVYVRTAAPWRSAAGLVDGELFSGTLTQSLFSRSPSENRTVSGARIQLRPAIDTMVTIGVARVVYAPVGPEASPVLLTLSHSLDALVRWETLDGAGVQRSDQIYSLFARWALAPAGLEVYAEWARMDLPRAVGELLTSSHHAAGWTVGTQYAYARGVGSVLRLQAELTNLEQTRVFADRPSPDFYSGQASPQGFTQRGQIIGAAIGPGASSQWVALDWFTKRAQVGAFAGRIRWDNDALYRRQTPTFFDHDVSMLGGVRGGWRAPGVDLALEVTGARRQNYLFQNATVRPMGFRTIDVDNLTFAFTATPR